MVQRDLPFLMKKWARGERSSLFPLLRAESWAASWVPEPLVLGWFSRDDRPLLAWACDDDDDAAAREAEPWEL